MSENAGNELTHRIVQASFTSISRRGGSPRTAPAADQGLQEHQVLAAVLSGMEEGWGLGAGGVAHGDEQRQLRSPVLQPGALTAADCTSTPSGAGACDATGAAGSVVVGRLGACVS